MCHLGDYNRSMYASKIRREIEKYLDARPDEAAFLRSEFDECGATRSGVNKALRAMVSDSVLLKGGYGVYLRTSRRRSTLSGNTIIAPSVLPEQWVREVLRKLGVDPQIDSATRAYNENRTTQVPVWLAFDVGASRIKRKLADRGRTVVYERSYIDSKTVDY